jgi:hypothetical protein
MPQSLARGHQGHPKTVRSQLPHHPATPPPEATKGIPNFWQVVFLRCDATRDAMNEKDVDVLRYLTDVSVGCFLGGFGRF